MSRLAQLLRRLADRIDPPGAVARLGASAAESDKLLVSRDELRAMQCELLTMIDNWVYVARSNERRDGLLWFPSDVLRSIAYWINHELEGRDLDFETVERDPRARLR